MFTYFKASYRVGVANNKAKKTPIKQDEQITQAQLNALNLLVKRLFDCHKAYLIVNKNQQGSYDIEFHSGIMGPINYFYFSKRFLAITHSLSSLKSVLTSDYSFMKNDEVIKDIRTKCQHLTAENIDFEIVKSHDPYERYHGVIRNLPPTFIYCDKYLAKDIMEIMTVAPYYPIFSHIQFALSKFGDSYFAINNLLSYFLAEMDKLDNYEVDSGFNNFIKIQASKAIHDQLVRHKIISDKDRYSIKKIGAQPGIILYTKENKNIEQRTFIKKINPSVGLYEMMVLQIAKECGCVVPDIQVFISPTKWCMMSKDVSNSASEAKQTYLDFFDIIFSPDIYLDTKNFRIYLGRLSDGSFINVAFIDKLSIAKIILMSILFNLIDVHYGNIGFRFREEDKQTTAELTLLDFEISLNDIYNKDYSFQEMVTKFAKYNDYDVAIKNTDKLHINTLEELFKGLTTEDYVTAFQSIKENYESAYILATTHSKKFIKDQSALRLGLFPKQDEPDPDYINVWAANFKLLNEKLSQEYKCERKP